MEAIVAILLHLATALALLGGLFFMLVGALGIVRLPDVYCRSHAASKCVTLGIIGLLAALVLFVASLSTGAGVVAQASATDAATQEVEAESAVIGEAPGVVALTKALLVVAFVFIAAPVGSHMLARAAHLAKVEPWHGSLGDELAEDDAKSNDGPAQT